MMVAAAFRTAFGFGEALIAVPLLSFILPIKVVAPLAVLASVVIALAAISRDWRDIHFGSAKKLLAATCLGIPIGVLLLQYGSEGTTKTVMAFVLILFSAMSLLKNEMFVLSDDRWIWLFGFLAGVTGGSYGMNGPPLAIYGVSRRWPAAKFRATIQAYFLPASLLGMFGYLLSGLWTNEVNFSFAASLPAIALGIFIGRIFTKSLDEGKFTRALYYILILIGCALLAQLVYSARD
jgi:uncharacterized membrane protein YfcA